MRFFSGKQQAFLFTVVFFLGFFTYCQPAETLSRLEINNGELLYTENINETVAASLGRYLAGDVNYFNGRPKSVKLDMQQDTFIFSAVVHSQAAANAGNISAFSDLGHLLSVEVFNNAPVTVLLCDNAFNPFYKIPFDPDYKKNRSL